jgi:hypothetical protein
MEIPVNNSIKESYRISKTEIEEGMICAAQKTLNTYQIEIVLDLKIFPPRLIF